MEAKRSTGDAPGHRLRQARESRGLTINDVADALRLSTRIISALEEDAHERLPGPTYVRGYLRNYAQFLGLPSQPLVDAYNDLPQAATRNELVSPAPVRQVTSSDMLVRLGTVVVAVIVLGLAALWWSGHNAITVKPVTPAATPPQPVANEASVPEPARNVVANEPSQPSAPAAEPAENEKPSVPAEKPAPSTTTATVAPAVEQTSSPATEKTPAPNPDVPLSRLVLYVHEDCWADVRDAQQHRLLYETIPAGRVVTVEGVAPLSVFLGNVEGVTVEFNGELYDAMRYKRGQVARFTLGSPQG